MRCKINDKDYTIKDRWAEFTYSEYCNEVNYLSLPLFERLHKQTDIPLNELTSLNNTQLSVILDAVSWRDSYEDAALLAKGIDDKINIGARSYGELEQCKLSLQLVSNPLLCLDKIIKVYTNEDVSGSSCLEVIARGLFIVNSINEFLNKYHELYEYEPTIEEIEAGVEDLSKLGSFYTIKKMSEKFGKHPDEILKWEASIVYSFLKADAIDARISRNLKNIYSRKK